MNIKSLLLGSAAALVAVSGARAADVIYVEPEPVEYVRVCDVYGTGFFYIPGTETCIRIGGHVRMQIEGASDIVNLEGDDYRFRTRTRARVNLDIREETELGLLRAYARFQANNTSANTDDGATGRAAEFTQAYIQLGGLLIGYRDSLWTNDVGGLEDGLLTDTDLVAGDVSRNQISYTFAAGGFSATLGVEDDGTGDAVPDVLGKLTYAGAWGGAFVSVVYDETVNSPFGTGVAIRSAPGGGFLAVPFSYYGADGILDGAPLLGEDGSNDAFAVKAGVKLNDLLVAGSTLAVEGHWASDPTPYASLATFAPGFIGTEPGVPGVDVPFTNNIPLVAEWAIGVGYSQDVGAFSVAVAGQYGELFDVTYIDTLAVGAPAVTTGGDFYRLVGNVGYDITNNFGVLAELSYTDTSLDGLASFDQTAGFLRFQRNF